MKVNIGKNTLGDNDKMSVSLREYSRSTHDLSYAWRSTMGIGTLVPCMKILCTAGDTFAIEMAEKVMTHPTIGPLFGSYKLQVDLFSCPIRLYNAMLHNNALNIGMDMSKVKLPKLQVENDTKTNPSSIFNYLGIKKAKAGRKYNAVPFLSVYDIFKNYYANKQEKMFYTINNSTGRIQVNIPQGNIAGINPFPCTEYPEGPKTMGINDSITVQIPTTYDITKCNLSTSYLQIKVTRNDGPSQSNNIGKLYLNQPGLVNVVKRNGGYYIDVIANTGEWPIVTMQNDIPDEVTNMYSTVEFLVADIQGATSLNAINLEDLDSLREDILSKGRLEYIIGSGGNCQITSINQIVQGMNEVGPLYGLPLKTHFSDIFNNWVKQEYISGENGIEGLTAIDTSGGSFTIDTLNLAQKVYNLLNRIAVSGGTYKDWIETVYSSEYYFRAETPVYEGGMSAEIEFNEVVSTSATEIENNEPLGTLAGKGVSTSKKGGTVTIKVNEPSYIIGLASITPRVDYSQGNDWDNDLDSLDDLHKPQLDGIGYQDLLQEWMHADANQNAAVGKTIAWINYMTNVNKTYGNFAVGQNEAFMCLNRVYHVGDNGTIDNYTTYINPKEFTGTFATNEISNQDFWVQLGFKIEARRVMSAKQIPIM